MPPTDGGIQSTALPPGQQLSAEAFGPLETKEDSLSLQRWTEILNRALERTIERQQRVTIEKVNGVKARKALGNGSLAIDMVFNTDIWDRQFEEDIRPVLSTIISDDFFSPNISHSLQPPSTYWVMACNPLEYSSFIKPKT